MNISPIHLFFLIRDLDTGGAQRQLTELVKGLDKQHFAITVATFYDGGGLRAELDAIPEVRVISLHKKGRWDVVPFLWRLTHSVHEAKPQIIHGYMGVANELALVVGRMLGAKVVWGIRHPTWIWRSMIGFPAGSLLLARGFHGSPISSLSIRMMASITIVTEVFMASRWSSFLTALTSSDSTLTTKPVAKCVVNGVFQKTNCSSVSWED